MRQAAPGTRAPHPGNSKRPTPGPLQDLLRGFVLRNCLHRGFQPSNLPPSKLPHSRLVPSKLPPSRLLPSRLHPSRLPRSRLLPSRLPTSRPITRSCTFRGCLLRGFSFENLRGYSRCNKPGRHPTALSAAISAQIAFQRHDHIILKMLIFLNTNT